MNKMPQNVEHLVCTTMELLVYEQERVNQLKNFLLHLLAEYPQDMAMKALGIDNDVNIKLFDAFAPYDDLAVQTAPHTKIREKVHVALHDLITGKSLEPDMQNLFWMSNQRKASRKRRGKE